MSERFLFFNSATGDPRKYQAQDFAEYFGSVLSSGLLHTDQNPNLVMSVETGTMNTVITPGNALIKGHLYENTTPLTLTHSIPEPDLDRIDRVVLRLNLHNSERNIKLHVKEGVSAANPTAPSLQRDNFIHELSLAQIKVRKNTVQLLASDIVDERLDENLCGLVYSLISIPSDQLQNWITARIAELGIVADEGLAGYLQAVVIAEDALQAAMNQHLIDAQGLYDGYSLQLQTKLAQFETDFNMWFQGLKDQLSTNVALSLQNQINIMNEALSRTDNKLNAHLSDYKYQVPSIVGTQIQVNRLSETTRLFFKIATDLTGNITISTDNGVTEKPLVDVDGSAVTQLEKGFVEVIAEAAFFTLRSRGISSSDKQALIEIVNEAEANESDLKTLFVNDINLKDAGAGLTTNSTWAEVLNRLTNMEMGKKFASGTITAASTSKPFQQAISGTSTVPYVSFDMNGLDFIPSSIYFVGINKSGGFGGLWVKENFYVDGSYYANAITSTGASLRAPFVNGIVDIPSGQANKIYDWLAYE